MVIGILIGGLVVYAVLVTATLGERNKELKRLKEKLQIEEK